MNAQTYLTLCLQNKLFLTLMGPANCLLLVLENAWGSNNRSKAPADRQPHSYPWRSLCLVHLPDEYMRFSRWSSGLPHARSMVCKSPSSFH